ncbi:MAG: deoxynucleoside kinase [Candidatus Woesebacteria bacterium]|nr:deoxynucleoside kinase [Candidatus Woesebacteria bacterium]
MLERNTDEQEKLPQRYPFIEVDGPPGIGKTTFTNLIAKSMGIGEFQEQYEENPYLENFYTSDDAEKYKYSFDCQMFFLATDAVQIRKAPILAELKPVVLDAGRNMNSIIEKVQWMKHWIPDDLHKVYLSADKNAYESSLRPDIHLAMWGDENEIIKRIMERGRKMELLMHTQHSDYFPIIIGEYDKWLERKMKETGNHIHIIDIKEYDFIESDKGKEAAITEVKNWLTYMISNPNQRNGVGSDGARLIMPSSFRTTPHIVDRVPGEKTYY